MTLLCEALLLLGIWVYVGVRVGIWTYNEYDRYIWLTDNLSVARELWHGNIKAGDNAEQLVKQWRPHEVERFGQWIKMDWFPGGPPMGGISLLGVEVIAKDNTLVEACYFSDDGLDARTFFDALTPEAEKRYRTAFEEFVKNLTSSKRATGPNTP